MKKIVVGDKEDTLYCPKHARQWSLGMCETCSKAFKMRYSSCEQIIICAFNVYSQLDSEGKK